MSSKRRLRRNQCKGKVRFTDEAAARTAIGRIRRQRGRRMAHILMAYPCPWCHGYHIGNSVPVIPHPRHGRRRAA